MRGRTTDAAKRNPSEPAPPSAKPAPARRQGARTARRPDAATPLAPPDDRAEADSALDPTLLARTLRAVADELERDPSLARRVAAAAGTLPAALVTPAVPAPPDAPGTRRTEGKRFQPRLVTGAGPELGPGIPDPFALRARLGHTGLATALAELRLGTLRAMVREHRLDPSGRLIRQNDAERLRALILEAVAQ